MVDGKGRGAWFYSFIPFESADDRKLRLQRRDEAFVEVGEWLFKGPFAHRI
jgi:hypothetical protein